MGASLGRWRGPGPKGGAPPLGPGGGPPLGPGGAPPLGPGGALPLGPLPKGPLTIPLRPLTLKPLPLRNCAGGMNMQTYVKKQGLAQEQTEEGETKVRG